MKHGASTNSQQATKLIQSGIASQSQGHTELAWAAYQAALDCVPEHPTALQLMGLLARKRGDLQAAENLMRRSLKTFPAQPQVWNNLGNVLDAGQRLEEALICFERAVAFDNRYAEANYNLARVLSALGRHADAMAPLLQSQALSPAPTAALHHLHASILEAQGDLPAAMAVLDEALCLAPERPALLHNRATLLQRCHRPAEALRFHERALALGLDAADAHYNHGNTLQSLGRDEEALTAYRRALQRQPGHALALYDMARLRWRLGDATFDDDLRQAVQQQPQSAVAAGVWANLLWRAERFSDAADAFALCLSREPDHAAWHDGLGRCWVRLGRHGEGLAAHEEAIRRDPQRSEWQINLASSLLLAREPQRAERAATEALRWAPLDQHALALLGLAWRLLGDPREAALNDYENLVSVRELPVPPGFASMPEFHAALTEELHSLHRDRAPPIDQTLRDGTQTLGDIFEQQHPLVNLLREGIAQQVDEHLRNLPRDTLHPFLSRRGATWRFADSWSSRLRRGGYHTQHVHPHGWLSSAAYISLPPGAADTQQRRGWLQLGQPDIDVGLTDPVRRWVQPSAGMLVLFPSYFWHGTSPFDDDVWRLTVAFDVLPAS